MRVSDVVVGSVYLSPLWFGKDAESLGNERSGVFVLLFTSVSGYDFTVCVCLCVFT